MNTKVNGHMPDGTPARVDYFSIESTNREIKGFLEENPDVSEAIDNMLHNALGANGYNPDWVTWKASFLLSFQEKENI
tara:strand:+ start:263 stop:496 length:234 start_codon:yes stop_codon:yes gene_type:complete